MSEVVFTDEEHKWIRDHRVIDIAGFTLDPFIIHEGSVVTGYFTEVVKKAATHAGLTPRFHFMTLNEALSKMDNGEIDVTMGLIQNPQRQKKYLFSKEEFPVVLHIFMKSEMKKVQSIDELKKLRIASYKGYALNQLLKKFLPEAKVIMGDTAEDMFRFVSEGEADAAIHEFYSGQTVLRQSLITNLTSKGIAEFGGKKKLSANYYAVSNTSPVLASILDKSHQDLSSSEKNEIWMQWFSFSDNALPSDVSSRIFSVEEQEWLKQNPKIKLGYATVYEPLVLSESTSYPQGMIPDIYNLLTKKYGIQFEYVLSDWKTTLNNLKVNKVDIIPAMAKEIANTNGYLISRAPFGTLFEIFTKNNELKIRSLDDLKGYKLAINGNVLILKNKLVDFYKRSTELISYKNTLDAFVALQNDEVDAVIAFNWDRYILLKNEMLEIKPVYTVKEFSSETITASKSTDQTLQSIISKMISSLTSEEITNVYKKWIGVSDEKDSNFLTKSERKFLEDKKELTVCARYKHYPISGEQNGKLTGITGEIFKRLSDVLGVRFKAIAADSDAQFDSNLLNNRCDLISVMKQNFNLYGNYKSANVPIFKQHFIAISNVEAPYYESLSENKRLTFYVKDSLQLAFLKKFYPAMNVKLAVDVDKAMDMIKEDKNILFVQLSILADTFIQAYGYRDYKVAGRLEKIDVIESIGVNLKYPEMITILDKTLNKIGQDVLDEIVSDYKSRNLQVYNYAYLYYAIATIILLSLIYLYRYHLLKKQSQEVETIFNIAPVPIAYVDSKGSIYRINNAFTHLFGYKKSDIPNIESWFLVAHPEPGYRDQVIDRWKKHVEFAYKSEGIVTPDLYKVSAKSGDKLTILIGGQLFKEGFIATFVDLTNEEATKQKLVEAKLLAENANKAKSVFLANMSHEIRTPLTATLGQLQLLSESQLNENQVSRLSKAQASSKLLLNTLNEILDFSKIEAGKLELEIAPFSIGSIVAQIDTGLRVIATEKGLDFNIEVDGNLPNYVSGDSTRLTQVLVNLINNSLKFTEKGQVNLKIEGSAQLGDSRKDLWKLNFDVIDTGIGIASERMESIFNSFEQAEKSTTRKYGGTGLGLSIAQNLVTAMGGELRVESEPGKGSRFYFSLIMPAIDNPAVIQSVSISQDILENKSLLQGLHILVAEDNLALQTVIHDLLESRGAAVTLASSGKEVVYAVSQQDHFDLVLMDIQMPKMDGQEATRQLRKEHDQQQLPIIAMTASAMKEDKEMALANGMNGYLVKPIDLARLVQEMLANNILVIDNLLDSSGAIVSTDENQSNGQDFSVEGFDVKTALKQLSNMPELYRDLAAYFIENIPSYLDKLAEGVCSQDQKAIEKTLHAIKGMTAQLGAVALSDWLKEQMETLKKGIDPVQLPEIERKTIVSIKEATGQLKEIVKKIQK